MDAAPAPLIEPDGAPSEPATQVEWGPRARPAAAWGEPCPACGGAPPYGEEERVVRLPVTSPYVYAIGKVEARYPTLSIEKEFAQVAGRSVTAGQTDAQLFHTVLSAPENRHLARLVCWVLTVRDIETYILRPRDPADLALLVEAIRPSPSPMDLDVVIGVRGPIAPPDLCNGLTVPMVGFDQIYSFDRDSFIRAIPRSQEMTDPQFDAAAGEVLDAVLHIADNAGATDDHRALNYLAMRYPEVYRRTAERFASDFSLSGVDVRRSPLGAGRNVVDCIFSFTSRRAAFTEKTAVSVDVTDEFPFLVSAMAPYYDRVTH